MNRRVRLALGTKRAKKRLAIRRLNEISDLTWRRFIEETTGHTVSDQIWKFIKDLGSRSTQTYKPALKDI